LRTQHSTTSIRKSTIKLFFAIQEDAPMELWCFDKYLL